MRNLILFFLVFTAFESYSQTFFEAGLTLNSGRKVHGFMVYYNEQSSYIRFGYETETEYQIVNINYTSSTGITEDSVNYFMLNASKPEYVSYAAVEDFNPVSFIWLWEKGDSTIIPLFSEGKYVDFSEAKEVDYFEKIDVSTIKADMLDLFYNSTESDYQSFIAALNHPDVDVSEYFRDKNKIQMHIIVCANTKSDDIGQSCKLDEMNFVNQFEEVAKALRIPVQKYIIDGENYSKKNLLSVLDTLKSGANDIVLFLYSGHGFRWDNQIDKYPNLDVRKSEFDEISATTTITLSEIYNSLKSKKPRLLLVFGDCCNSKIGVSNLSPVNYLSSMALPNFKKDNLINLFLKSEGSIIAAAASPNEVSWCNSYNGGFFTLSFIQAFRQELGVLNKNNVSWDSIVKNTVVLAKQKSSYPLCPDCSQQNALQYVNARLVHP